MTVQHRAGLVAGLGLLALSALALGAQGATAQAGEPGYTYVRIGVFGTASSDGRGTGAAWDANNSRQVAGASTTDVFGAGRAFRWDGRLMNLGVIGGGTFAASAAFGINDAGVVVGQSHVNGTDPPHAFLHRDGVMTDLGTGYGAGSFSRAWEVNEAGVAVGERARQQSSPLRAVLWRDGRLRDLGTLGGVAGPFGTSSVAYGINDRAQVVGAALPRRGPLHPFLWARGVMRDLGTLAAGDAGTGEAQAINNARQVVGWASTSDGDVHAFRWHNDAMRDLGTLGGDDSYAYGINRAGDVVGGSRAATSPPGNAGRAFLWSDGEMVDLNSVVTNLPRNVTLEVARAINDDGSIAGTTCTDFCEPGRDAPTRGFLLIPN